MALPLFGIAEENQELGIANQIIAKVLAKVESVRRQNPKALVGFLVDWDGTIIKGDITEGLASASNGKKPLELIVNACLGLTHSSILL